MKEFKKLDYLFQAVLLVIGIISVLALGFDGIPMYFVVGGWQVMSVIIHLFIRKEYKVNLRKVYLVLLIATMVVGFLCAFSNAIFNYLAVLLVWSPVLAIMYLICCFEEVKKMSKATNMVPVDEETKREL